MGGHFCASCYEEYKAGKAKAAQATAAAAAQTVVLRTKTASKHTTEETAWKLSKIPHILNVRPGDYVKIPTLGTHVIAKQPNFLFLYMNIETDVEFGRCKEAKLVSTRTGRRYKSLDQAYAEWSAKYD